MKKWNCIALASVLMATAVCGACAPGQLETHSNAHVVTDAGIYPVVKEEYRGITLDMMALNHASISADWASNEFFKRMESLTGVKFNFEKVYDAATYTEKFPLAFVDVASMPDVFYKAQIPRDSEAKFGAQGLLIPLENLIENYAPNLKKIMEETPNVKRVITAADGHVYSLPTVHYKGDRYTADGVFWINKKWCDRLQIDVSEITTIEKLNDVLTRFKNEDANGNGVTDDEKPMYLAGAYEVTHLFAAFGMNLLTWNAYVDNGTVKLGAMQENFKPMLKYLNEMYKEGLINNNYVTLPKNTVWAEGRSGDTIGVFFDATADLVAGDRARDFVALPPLNSSVYTGTPFMSGRYAVDPGAFAISANCEYPELAMRWIDTVYDVEYSRWDTVGQEGVEWKWDDEEHTTWSYLMPTDEIVSKRTVQMGGGLPGVELTYDDFLSKSSDPLVSHSAKELAKVSAYIKPGYPPVSFNETTLRALSSTSTSLSTYLGTLMAQVIRGEKDIEKNWNTIQNDLKRMGAANYVKTLQEGYNRFMQNV